MSASLTEIGRRLDVDRVLAADVLVIGSGVAGLSAALAARPRRVLLATKGRLASGSSPYAQGGIAAAVDPDDAPRWHATDTERAGRGLCESDVVQRLTDEAPSAIRELESLGVAFDRDPKGTLLLGREGGHGRSRILHAGGDRTGAAIVEALLAAARRAPHLAIEEELFVVDLLRIGNRIAGAVAIHESGSSRTAILARDTVLATGGLGQIYRFTTNPAEVTGDGIAMAARASARLVDMEFVQFHPTALGGTSADGSARPLLTEALRGAGALVVDESGRRFLTGGELSPRDVVALDIFRHRKAGHEVYLDLRTIEALEQRFPTVLDACRNAGIEPSTTLVPVTPAAHYAMGGVAIDDRGRTSLEGLWACGETASAGAHGANRLASNSLLEAIVFGRRLGRELGASSGSPLTSLVEPARAISPPAHREGGGRDVAAARGELQELTWRYVGLERARHGLTWALTRIEAWCEEREAERVTSRAVGELRNMTLVAALVTLAASLRCESRGAHYRTDYPEPRRELERRFALRLVPGRAPLAQRIVHDTLEPEREEPVLAAAMGGPAG